MYTEERVSCVALGELLSRVGGTGAMLRGQQSAVSHAQSGSLLSWYQGVSLALENWILPL